ASSALVLGLLFFPLDGVQVIAASALRAAGDEWMPTLTHTISYVIVMLPLGYWLGVTLGYGVPGLMWTMIIASVFAAAFLLARFLWVTRRGASLPEPRAI
ncbi:MAG: MATE family efflux transporter, partial [Pacificimonas sp.]